MLDIAVIAVVERMHDSPDVLPIMFETREGAKTFIILSQAQTPPPSLIHALLVPPTHPCALLLTLPVLPVSQHTWM
jgi:hypothetical protein